MVFGWFKRQAQIAVVNSMDTDITRFLRGLEGNEASTNRMILGVATHVRHYLEHAHQADLLQPILEFARKPIILMKLNAAVRQLQKLNQPQLAVGAMVWLHTFRSATTPEIRLKGRAMWGELARGISFVEEQAKAFLEISGTRLDIEGYDRIPEDLRPDFRS